MIDAEKERSVIEATCWGTLGSIASPGPDTVRFGGNTPCLEVRIQDGRRFIFDAGTGIRPLGMSMMDEAGTPDAVIFLTHFHWDHIQGFPFFLPLYESHASLRIVGPDQAEADIEELFAKQMASTNSPAPCA
jgi:phosphoribosyl 1,2-cyclic phosphodiesterase